MTDLVFQMDEPDRPVRSSINLKTNEMVRCVAIDIYDWADRNFEQLLDRHHHFDDNRIRRNFHLNRFFSRSDDQQRKLHVQLSSAIVEHFDFHLTIVLDRHTRSNESRATISERLTVLKHVNQNLLKVKLKY